jgi:hypothetical protein
MPCYDPSSSTVVIKNIAASVRARLMNRARETSRPFQEVLQFYGLERFLYRLSLSTYRDQFVLKGALVFRVWRPELPRPTRDIDLLGYVDNSPSRISAIMAEVCVLGVEPDGLSLTRTRSALSQSRKTRTMPA